MKYKGGLNRVSGEFSQVTELEGGEVVEELRLPRRFEDGATKALQVFTCKIDRGGGLNSKLLDLAASGKLSDSKDIQVSNAGEWHSKPHFFAIDDGAVASLFELVKRCLLWIEGRVDVVCGPSGSAVSKHVGIKL